MKRQAGFTIIELLIVVTILAMLAVDSFYSLLEGERRIGRSLACTYCENSPGMVPGTQGGCIFRVA